MSTVARPDPERHGKTRMYILINEDVYLTRRVKADAIRLTKTGGDRAGSIYLVGRHEGQLTCTCPDHLYHPGSNCKHIGAILANRLLRRPRPRKAVANG